MVISEIIEQELWANMDTTIEVSGMNLSPNGTLTISAKDWKWAKLLDSVILDGNEYPFKWLSNDSISMENQSSKPSKVKVRNFFYYRGTAIDVTSIFSRETNIAADKLPIMWCSYNPIPVEKRQYGTDDLYPIDVTATIYLAGLTDYSSRHDKEHLRQVVAYLDVYANQLAEVIRYHQGIFSPQFSIDKRQMPIFGKLGSNGFVQNVLDDTNMAAIELDLNFSLSEKHCKQKYSNF